MATLYEHSYTPGLVRLHGRAEVDSCSTLQNESDTSSLSAWNEDGDEDGDAESSDSNTSIRYLKSQLVTNCRFCTNELPQNPDLCEPCQVWNDARHVFDCVPPATRSRQYNYISTDTSDLEESDWIQRRFRPEHGEGNVHCIVCRFVACSAFAHLRQLGIGPLEPSFLLRVVNGGPYHFQPFLPRGNGVSRRRRPFEVDSSEDQQCAIKCVFLLRLSAPESIKLWTADDLSNPRCKPKELWVRTFEANATLHYTNDAVGLLRIDSWDEPYFDCRQLASWVDSCVLNHKGECSSRPDSLPKDFRVIDTQGLCIVKPLDTLSFAALSYVWSQASEDGAVVQMEGALVGKFSKPGALSNVLLPKLLSDAITLCQDLRVRFLWVDRLCIVQDDVESKLQQINAMDKIYRSADLTIVAAVDGKPGSGLPGVRGRPRGPPAWKENRSFHGEYRCVDQNMAVAVDCSQWNTRGWTFQERLLSRRCIILTGRQAYFLCAETAYQEEIGLIRAFADRQSTSLLMSRFAANNRDVDRERAYYRLIEEYTSRKLSHSSDLLNAIAGVGNALESLFSAEVYSGHLAVYFLPSLLWRPSAAQVRVATPMIPSWSWAGWVGSKTLYLHDKAGDFLDDLICYYDPNSFRLGTLVDYHVVSQEGLLSEVYNQHYWFGHEPGVGEKSDASRLSRPPNWRLLRHKTPSEEDVASFWHSCPHNPFNMIANRVLDADAVATGSTYPGSLIFNTTVASLSLQTRASITSRSRAPPDADMPLDGLLLKNLDGEAVGRIAMTTNGTNAEYPKMDDLYEVIVLGAGVLHEWFWDRSRLHGYLGGEGFDPWLLHVMLIERDAADPVICRRVTIGTIEARCWASCNPCWSTIVLA